jgi:integrase
MVARKEKHMGWIVDFVFLHQDGRKQRVRRKSPVQNRRGTEQFERGLREKMASNDAQQPTRKEAPTLKEFSKDFIETYAVNNNKPSEVKGKKSIFKHHLLDVFGRTRIDKIGAKEIEKYKNKKLKEGLSPKTINNHLTVLRRCLSLAAEWEIIDFNLKLKWMKVPKQKFDFLTFEEAERLIEGAEGDFRTMIILALKTGLRQGELLGLQWDDVDLVAGRLVVRHARWRGHMGTPKNGRTRVIPLSPDTLKVIKRHRHLKGKFVFCNQGGEPLLDGKCKWPLWTACANAGLRRIGWHVLRHTFASHLVMRGVSLKAVQELLGHATMEMTMRYSHLSPEVGIEAVAKLDLKPTRQSHGSNKAVREHR